MEYIIIGVVGIGAFGVIGFGTLAMATRFYRKVDQGQALIINKTSDANTVVTFSGGFVLPVVHRAEVMDLSVKTIDLERRGSEGLICRDNIRADIKVTFFVRVNPKEEEVLKVARSIGCSRASDQKTLEELFVSKFSEALKTVGKRMDFEQLYTQRDVFKEQILEVIGKDLNGYMLDDAVIDFLEQTPVAKLDKDNILDSEGIRKIVQITSQQNASTNELRQKERMTISKQNLEADEAILELGRRRAEAEAKQKREVSMVQAREESETKRFQSKQSEESEVARIQAEEAVQIAELNRTRQVDIADKDRERVLAIKHEEVERDRQLEVIGREREVELQRIDKEKALEVQRKEIADVVRARIAVEKNVAEEEERIKDLRNRSEAERLAAKRVIAAEAEASEGLVKNIKAAEASEKVAEFKARERLTLANADLEAADKDARAKIRQADGLQAQVAAEGLAQARVKEADAVASEKLGLSRARVTLEQMQAEAHGEEQKGQARLRVEETEVAVRERRGLVDAALVREKLQAEAQGEEQKGLAQSRVRQAEAEARQKEAQVEALAVRERLLAEAAGLEQRGLAEARAVRERMGAEAAGIAEKAAAMRALEGTAREHEEFRLRLEMVRSVELANIEARRQIAESQARVLAEAFGKADIRIVGGDGAFFDRFVKAASLGSSVDSFLSSSDTLRGLVGENLEHAGALVQGVGEGLGQVVDAVRGAARKGGEQAE